MNENLDDSNSTNDVFEKDTSVGVIAYITLIGFIIALVMNNDKTGETKKFGAFHLRQAIGLMLTGIVFVIGLAIISIILAFIPAVGPFIIMLIYPVFWLGMLALLIIGIIGAANGKKKPLPIVGEFIEKTFKQAFE